MKKFVISRDRTAPKVQDEFHFDKGSYNKTFIGGCCSLAVSLFLLYYVYTSVMSMIAKEDFYYSLTETQSTSNEKVKANSDEMPLLVFTISDS